MRIIGAALEPQRAAPGLFTAGVALPEAVRTTAPRGTASPTASGRSTPATSTRNDPDPAATVATAIGARRRSASCRSTLRPPRAQPDDERGRAPRRARARPRRASRRPRAVRRRSVRRGRAIRAIVRRCRAPATPRGRPWRSRRGPRARSAAADPRSRSAGRSRRRRAGVAAVRAGVGLVHGVSPRVRISAAARRRLRPRCRRPLAGSRRETRCARA